MVYRGVPARRPRPTHVQAKRDSERRRELARRQQRAGHPELASARRWRWYSLASLFVMAGNTLVLLNDFRWYNVVGAVGCFVFSRLGYTVARSRLREAATWNDTDDKIDSLAEGVNELHELMDGLVEDYETEKARKAEQTRDEASWQAIIYGEHSLYATTQRAINEIDAELNAMVDQEWRAEAERKEAMAYAEHLEQMRATKHAKKLADERRVETERKMAEEAELKWKAMPAEARAMGCSTCRSMTHPEVVCVAGPLVAERKQIEGEWITTWETAEPVRKVEYSQGGIVAGIVDPHALPAFDRAHDRLAESYADRERNEKVLHSAIERMAAEYEKRLYQ